MDPLGAGALEVACHRERILGVDRRALHVALDKRTQRPPFRSIAGITNMSDRSAAATAASVSPASAAKLARICRPTAWLFSGWNWQAKTLSCQTDDANSPP